MVRSPEWLQRGLDALKATLDVGPELKHQMVQFLLDEGFWDARKLSYEAAITRFNACLNPSKSEFFKITEVWALMQRFRRFDLFLAMAEDLGFDTPRLRPTEERRLELIERLTAVQERATQETALIRAALEQLARQPFDPSPDTPESGGGRRVHPAMRERGPRFSLDNREQQGF